MPLPKVDPGYYEADSSNLPRVTEWMLVCFFKNESFLNPEMRNAKVLRSGRANYGDNAIGRCQLRKDGDTIEIKAIITPEHRISAKPYSLSCLINQKEQRIIYARCESCIAKEDCCKHAVAFIFWLQRKSMEPPITSVQSYWNRPILAGCQGKTVKVNDEIETQVKNDPCEAGDNFFKEANELFLKSARGIAGIRQLSVAKSLALHHLVLSFKCDVEKSEFSDSGEVFLTYCTHMMKDEDCKKMAKQTKAQADSQLWFDLRYARITGSKVYEASRNQTPDGGTLLKSILGAIKIKQTEAMSRGQRLESEVLKVVSKKYGLRLEKTGFVMNRNRPIFGASPDALLSDFVVEVKCPSSEESYVTYFKNNMSEPANKYAGQMHLQMLMCDKTKALFCVAHPNFESNKQVKIMEVGFDQTFCDSLMRNAKNFWIRHVYKVLHAHESISF